MLAPIGGSSLFLLPEASGAEKATAESGKMI